jgi:hypothetical protein
MEDRIEINGVWYVRETSSTPPPNIIEIDESLLTTTQQIIYEDGDYCFVASRIYKTDERFYDDFAIEITDKRSKDKSTWKEEYLDNVYFLHHLKNNHPGSIEEMSKIMCKDGINTLISLLNTLEKKGWFEQWCKSKNINYIN